MPSYLITGVSRGLGWEFLSQLSADPNNVVVGIVRNKGGTDKRVSEELNGRSNITIVEADITDFNALKASVAATAEVTGGTLDYLVANAGALSEYDSYDPLGVLFQDPQVFTEELTKALHGNITWSIKKAIFITSGHSDPEPVRTFDISTSAFYSISKAGMNMAIAKLSAQYKQDGILFLSISPGIAETGHHQNLTPHQMEAMGQLAQKLAGYAPNFKGPSTAENAVRNVISVWEKASIENGHGGGFLSHRGEYGNWL